MFVWAYFALFFAFLPKAAPEPVVFELFDLSFVAHINAFFTTETLTTDLISVDFDVKNLLFFPLFISDISSRAGVNDTIYVNFHHTFEPPFRIDPFQTANSGTINDVKLTQGAAASLVILPLGVLDIDSNVTLGLVFPIAINGLKQSDVPTNYTLELE